MTGDTEVRDLVMGEADGVFTAFQAGSHNVSITSSGFLLDGNIDTSLTWMDAKYDGDVVTDRSGMAVEIQMLWYNLLQIALQFKREAKVTSLVVQMQTVAELLEQNFMDRFWFDEGGYLHDVIKPDMADSALRPNQVIGLYLPFQLVSNQSAKQILAIIEQELLTPVGLKTLSSDHPLYKPYYGGSQYERDYAYHQGTVWPFILGHYLIAYLKAYDYSDDAKLYVMGKLKSFQDHVIQAELEYVPEIYSADDLRPEGCISQAWSAATLLEVLAKL